MSAVDVGDPCDAAPQLAAGGIDFYSDEHIDNPYETYRRLREAAPVSRVDGLNAWVVTRFKDVKAALLNDKVFKIDFDRLQTNRMGEGVVNDPWYVFGRNFLAFADRPYHPDLKKLLLPIFTRTHAENYLPRMREHANDAIDAFIDAGEAEMMSAYAHNVPLRVISDLLGIPDEDRRLMESWVNAYSPVIGFPPMSPAQVALANDATEGFNGYFEQIIAERRARPGDDLVSQVVAANDAREHPFEPQQVVANLILMYFAGQDTQKGLVGNMLVALEEHPEQRAWLQEDISRVWEGIHELMRYDSVSQITGRVAAEDTELGGMKIAAGQTVLLGLGSASRDPEIFEDPDRFDLQRPDARAAMVFGMGPHACLGTHFVRLLMPVMLETLYTRIPNFRIDMDSLVRTKTLSKRGFASIRATW